MNADERRQVKNQPPSRRETGRPLASPFRGLPRDVVSKSPQMSFPPFCRIQPGDRRSSGDKLGNWNSPSLELLRRGPKPVLSLHTMALDVFPLGVHVN